MLTDTHCHLDFHRFASDRAEVLKRARQAGVRFLLDPGIDLPSSREAISLAEKYPEVHAAVGVHPNSATVWTETTLAELRELAQHEKVVAIGEIGLDYYRDRAPRDLQQRVFCQQLDLAAALGLPVVIHTRDAANTCQAQEDVLGILAGWLERVRKLHPTLADRPGVFHSYAGSAEMAQRVIALGFAIGVTGPVTFRNAPDQQRLVAALPLERLLVETDAPFLAPHPHRGQRNEPAFVRLTAEKIAELHGQSFERVAQVTTANAQMLFHWSNRVD